MRVCISELMRQRRKLEKENYFKCGKPKVIKTYVSEKMIYFLAFMNEFFKL